MSNKLKKLKELSELLESGAITQDEFEALKKEAFSEEDLKQKVESVDDSANQKQVADNLSNKADEKSGNGTLIFGVGIIVIGFIILITFLNSGPSEEEKAAAEAEAEAMVEEMFEGLEDAMEE